MIGVAFGNGRSISISHQHLTGLSIIGGDQSSNMGHGRFINMDLPFYEAHDVNAVPNMAPIW